MKKQSQVHILTILHMYTSRDRRIRAIAKLEAEATYLYSFLTNT